MAGTSVDKRVRALRDWLAHQLRGAPFAMEPASGDASFRRYFRVTTQDHSLIAMDAPPGKEDSRPFIAVARLLSQAGLNVPQVLEADLHKGFLLLTDLGQHLYLQALQREERVRLLYHDAIDALVAMQAGVASDGLPPYDRSFLLREMQLFQDWLLDRHLGIKLEGHELQETFEFLADAALTQPAVFVHRDFHSRNLMVCAGNNPGILDFQDAMCGPLSYDLVSLLKDCYVKWPDELIDELLAYYLQAAGTAGLPLVADKESFRTAFDLMGVQRHLKASGIFARLRHRDNKHAYLADVPRTLSYILDCADRHGELTYLARLIAERVLPGLGDGNRA